MQLTQMCPSSVEEKQGRALKLARFLSTDLSVTDMLLRSNSNSQERREKTARQRIESFDNVWAKNS